MKGMLESLIMIAIECILLFIFITILFHLFSSKNYEAIVVANVAMLQNAINNVCAEKESYNLSLSLPQTSIPKLFGINFLSGIYIHELGDPDYLLYYESFPFGEGIGWEVYIKELPRRIFIPIDDSFMLTADSKKKFLNKKKIQQLKMIIENKFPNEDVEIVIPNIIIDDIFSPNPLNQILGEEEEMSETEKAIFGKKLLGNWINDYVYKFKRLNEFSPIEKTLIKYRPCGDNSLCLKTPNNIYKFPITCKGIDYIQLQYDAREKGKIRTSVGIVSAASLGTILIGIISPGVLSVGSRTITSATKFLGPGITGVGATTLAVLAIRWIYVVGGNLKTSDFYIASPCEIYKVNIMKCTRNSKNCVCACNEFIRYPIWKYEDGKFEKIGEHQTCADNIGKVFTEYVQSKTIIKYSQPIFQKEPINCIAIKVEKPKKDFCWTPNPFLSVSQYIELEKDIEDKNLLDKIKQFFIMLKKATTITLSAVNIITDAARRIGGLPVSENAKILYYSQNDIYECLDITIFTMFVKPKFPNVKIKSFEECVDKKPIFVLSPWEVADSYWRKFKDVFVEKNLIWSWPSNLR